MEYQVISGNKEELTELLNHFAKFGWRPVTMSNSTTSGANFTVILEKKADK